MGEGESSVEAGGVVSSTKLIKGHQFVLAEVEVDASCDNLLNEFAEAFNELDGLVGFGC